MLKLFSKPPVAQFDKLGNLVNFDDLMIGSYEQIRSGTGEKRWRRSRIVWIEEKDAINFVVLGSRTNYLYWGCLLLTEVIIHKPTAYDGRPQTYRDLKFSDTKESNKKLFVAFSFFDIVPNEIAEKIQEKK